MIGLQTRNFGQGTMLLLALALSACAGTDGPEKYTPASGSYVTVPVKSGDTASSVARRYHVEQDDVLAMNNLSDARQRLPAGNVRVPAYGTAPVEPAPEAADHPYVPVHSHYTRSTLPPPA